MGKGLAKEFKKLSKEAFEEYKGRCERGELRPGVLFVHKLPNGRQILHFPTKNHWRAQSKLPDIQLGLSTLREEWNRLGITSLSLPAIGCGLGGLDWESQVRPLIHEYFDDTDRTIELYPFGSGSVDRKSFLIGEVNLPGLDT